MSRGLSENDVLARLFAPTANLPKSRGGRAMVVLARESESSASHIDLENLLLRALSHLKAEGVGQGDNVVFCCENRLEYLPILLACWALEVTATLIDFRVETGDLFAACEKLKAKMTVTARPMSQLTLNLEPGKELPWKVLNVADFSISKIKPAESSVDYLSIDLDKPLLALFTSGTTGAPKTAVHSLRTVVQNIIDLADAVDMDAGMIAMTPLPVSHIFGLSVMIVTQVLGMQTVLTALDPISFIKAEHKFKPHLIAALPQFYGALLAAPKGIIELSDARLLLCGGAPLTVSLIEKFEEHFGKKLNNGYGSTESKIFAFNQDGPTLSVGKAVGGVEIAIVDEQGEAIPDGIYGEVVITSQTLMNEYWGDQEKTKKVLTGNKYKTGDYGYLEKGYLFVAGRKDDIVVVDNKVIRAAEIEAALRNSPQIKEVAVIDVPDDKHGQAIKACIAIMDEEAAKGLTSSYANEVEETKQKLIQQFEAFCKVCLPPNKQPTKWHFVGPHDDFPKTLAGKVDKKALKSVSHT